MTARFEGKGVVVTGAAQGVGFAAADAFSAEGAAVALFDIQADRVRVAAEELTARGRTAIPVECDVTDADSVETAIAAACRELGHIDVLVNNAGAITMGLCTDLTEVDWDLAMDVNAKGVFLGTRAVLPHMLSRGSGAIVNTSSEAGKLGMPLISHYCAAKHAVIGFTRAVAREVAPTVRVNAVCPGTVNTPMMERNYDDEERLTGATRGQIEQALLAEIPMGRFQQPEQIARVMLFLASDDASELTGEAVNVAGGKLQS